MRAERDRGAPRVPLGWFVGSGSYKLGRLKGQVQAHVDIHSDGSKYSAALQSRDDAMAAARSALSQKEMAVEKRRQVEQERDRIRKELETLRQAQVSRSTARRVAGKPCRVALAGDGGGCFRCTRARTDIQAACLPPQPTHCRPVSRVL